MKKILKHKRIIAFLLVFTLTFGVVSEYNKKETQGAFVIDDITIILLGLTVLATGVIATSDLQIEDMGSRVWNKLVDLGVDSIDAISKLDLTGNRHLLMNDLVLDSALYVAENLPTTKTVGYEKTRTTDVTKNPLVYTKVTVSDKSKRYYYDFSNFTGTQLNFSIGFDGRNNYGGYLRLNGTEKTIRLEAGYRTLTTNILSFRFIVDGVEQAWYTDSTYTTGANDVNLYLKNYSGTVTGSFGYEVDYTSSSIKEGYNETVINERVPWNRGIDELGNASSIGTISSNSPVVEQVINRDITQDVPLVWEDVKDGFVEKTIDGDIVKDKTIDDTIDVDIPQELNLWTWLKTLLKAILESIKTIIGTFTGWLESLINALKNLLLFLFAPTVTITELFPVPTTNGLTYIPMLFDYSRLWNITPTPIEFGTNINRQGVGTNISRNWNVEFKPFEISFIKNNLNMIRNLTSYTLLMFVVWNILHHFMPKRDMD